MYVHVNGSPEDSFLPSQKGHSLSSVSTSTVDRSFIVLEYRYLFDDQSWLAFS